MKSETKQNLLILSISVTLLLISIGLARGNELNDGVITDFDYSLDSKTNRLTSVLTANDSVLIDHVFSYGLIEQKHIITINSPAKNITINPRMVYGVMTGEFNISKEVNRTVEYPVYDNIFSEIKKIIGYESYNVTERVYGGNEWNSSGKFYVEYETPINSFGKIDVEICLDGICYLFDPWWNSSYAYRKTITVNMAGLPTDFNHNPLLIKLNSSNFNFSRIQSDCDDIRFVDSTDTTEYDYDTELCNVAGQVLNVWVKPTANSISSLRMYYGNPTATSNEDEPGTWSQWAVVYNFQNNYLDALGNNHLTTVNNYAYSTTACPSGYCIIPSGGALDAARGSAFSNLDHTDVGRFVQAVVNSTSTSDAEYALFLDDSGEYGLGIDDYFAGGYASKLATYCVNDVPTSFVNASTYNAPTNAWQLYSTQYIRRYISGLALFHNGTTTGITSTYTADTTHYLLDDDAGTYFEIHLPDGRLDFIRIDDTYVSTTIDAARDRNNVTWQILFNNNALFTVGSEEQVPTINVIFEEPINSTTYTYTPTLRFKPVTNNATTVNCSVNINSNITSLFNIANNTLTNISLYNVYDDDKYTWNDISVNCSATSGLGYHYGSNNTRFGLNIFNLTWEAPDSFNNPILDNTIQLYNLTVTIVNSTEVDTDSFIGEHLRWNNTNYYETIYKEVSGSNIYLYRNFTVPVLNTTFNYSTSAKLSYNVTHKLTNFSYDDYPSGGSFDIYRAWVGNCTGTGFSPTINFSLIDEVTNNSVRGDLNLNLTITSPTPKNYSFTLTNSTNFTLCINGPFSYQVYTAGEYYNDSYPLRNHYLINTTLSNSSVLQVNLYSLINNSATLVQVNVKDATGNDIEGVIVLARRQYLGEGVIKGVAMGQTDDEGNCIMPLEWYYPKYDFQVFNATTVELLKTTTLTSIFSTPVRIIVPITPIYDYWDRVNNIMYNYSTTEAGGSTNFTSNVIDLNGDATSVTLTCTKRGILGNTILYANTVAGSSVSLTCPLGNITGNEYFMVTTIDYAFGDDIIYTEFVSGTGIGLYGDEGVFVTILVVAAFAVSGIVNPVLSVLTAIIGLVLMNMLGLTYLTTPTIMSFVAIGVLIAYLTRRRGQ